MSAYKSVNFGTHVIPSGKNSRAAKRIKTLELAVGNNRIAPSGDLRSVIGSFLRRLTHEGLRGL